MAIVVRSIPFVVLFSGLLAAQSGYVPERVFHSGKKAFTDFEAMVADVARADVVLVGEQHDDPNTHALELALLEGIARRRSARVIVSLEMFERDVQEPLDHFQSGRLEEQAFLKTSRPWPNYGRDYKPLVEFAMKQEWPVIASNVPRGLASEVSKTGLGALKTRSAEEEKWFAKDLVCPFDDDYFDRFAEAMGEHPEQSAGAAAGKAEGAKAAAEKKAAARRTLERYYQAQCLKDETMSESIARAFEMASVGGPRPLVVHFNGAFHSDFTLGTAQRTKRRLPGRRVIVLSLLPVDNLDTLSPDKAERKRADYLVYTIKSRK